MAEIKFEEAMGKLEKIVEELESEKLPLERSLALFEQGMELIRICQRRLAEAEKKIEMLTTTEGGERIRRPFVLGEENSQARAASGEDKPEREGSSQQSRSESRLPGKRPRQRKKKQPPEDSGGLFA